MDRPSRAPTPQQVDGLIALAEDLFNEAQRCANAELWRAAILSLGGAVEAAIVATAIRLEARLREQEVWPRTLDPLRWSLGDATQLARNAGWLATSLTHGSDDLFAPLQGEVGDAVRFLVAIRNMLVHPGVYVREDVRPDLADIDQMRPTYEILHGIAAQVFGRLSEALTLHPSD